MIAKPDYHKTEEFQNRSNKLKEIKDFGIDPYPNAFYPSHKTHQVHEAFKEDPPGECKQAEEGKTAEISVAGRLVLFRAMGKNAFGHIQDPSGRLQIMFNRDLTKLSGYEPSENEPNPLKFLEKKLGGKQF